MRVNGHFTPAFRKEITRRNPLSQEWLDRLPLTLGKLQRQWDLTQEGPASFGKTSLVIPVMSSYGPAALKLVSPAGDVEAEERALGLLAGGAVVQLHDASISDRALLLDRLEKMPSIPKLSLEESVTIAGNIAARLATVTAPADIPRLAANADGWVTGIREQHELAKSRDLHVADEQLLEAQDAIRALGTDTTSTMTHGDLSLENIMRSTSGVWVAIDPLLVCGPVIHETHTVVRSLLPQILAAANPHILLAELTKRFCDTAGADYESAQRLSLARYVASYYWETQNGGDPANIDRLRRASDLTFQLLQ